MVMKVEEFLPDEERLGLISNVIDEAATLLCKDIRKDSPKEIVSAVYEVVVDLVFGKPTPVSEDENPHFLLGALWGNQMARQFNWYWANVVIDDKYNEVAMISPKREMIIFPFSFTRACLEKQCICTILLAFNMLIDNKLGKMEPDTYQNIMLNIHHVIPPYTIQSNG
jgi:hypothetical protein